MAEFVLIKTFSGIEKVSERKITLNEYYDGDCYEIDDKNFIIKNNITKIAIFNELLNEKAYNFYDNNGFPIKFITLVDEMICRVEFCRKDNIFSWLDIEYNVESNIVNIRLNYKLMNSPQNIVIKGSMINNDICIGELFSVKIVKESDEILFQGINIQNINNFEFKVEVSIDENIILQLR